MKFNGSMWDIYSVMIWYIHMVRYTLDYSDKVRPVLPRKILLRCAAQKACAWGLEELAKKRRHAKWANAK